MEHTILVVEDEQGIREAIGIYMKNQGYNVILAANGKEGLEKIETNDIHLAIVDIMMPIMDGFEASDYISKKKPHIPIVALTAISEEINKELFVAASIKKVLSKPVNVEELYDTILQLVTE